MQKDLKVDDTVRDKKTVKYFKKYKSKLRTLRIILLIIIYSLGYFAIYTFAMFDANSLMSFLCEKVILLLATTFIVIVKIEIILASKIAIIFFVFIIKFLSNCKLQFNTFVFLNFYLINII